MTEIEDTWRKGTVKMATASPGTLCHDYAEAELEGISGMERKAEGREELHTVPRLEEE